MREAAAENGELRSLAEGSGKLAGQRRPARSEGLWCPICLCVLTHVPVLEGLMDWLRMFHWCLVRLEGEAGGIKRARAPSELDAAVFQLTLEVRRVVVCLVSGRWSLRASLP